MPRGWEFEERFKYLFKTPPPMNELEAAEVILRGVTTEECRACWHLSTNKARGCSKCWGTKETKSLEYRRAESALGIGLV